MSIKDDFPKNVRVPSYHCCEQDGYVWISMAADKPEKPPTKLPYMGIKGWKYFDMVTFFDGSVEDCLENFLDCAHAQHVHKYWFRSPIGKKIKASVRTEDTGAVIEYFNEPRQKSFIWKTFGRHKASQNNAMIHTDRFIASIGNVQSSVSI
jgi:phenylpropionate dioxygenase-like ring-hydroxylating dioxygenase large terminal subunit